MKIQKRLLVSILPIVFISIITITVVSVLQSSNTIEKQVKDNAELLSNSYSLQLNSKLRQYKKMAGDLSSAIVTAVNVETVLLDARKRYPEMGHILYTTMDGSVKDMAPYTTTLVNANYKDFPKWQEAISKGEAVFSDPLMFMGEEVVLLFSPVVIDYVVYKDPETLGVTIIAIPTTEVFGDIKKLVYGDTGSAFVLNEKGIFISSKNKDYINKIRFSDQASTSDLSRIESSMVNQYSGLATFYSGVNKNFVSFAGIPECEWSLGITGEYSEFSSKVNSIIYLNILILVLSIIFTSILIYFMVHGVVVPIEALTKVAEKITGGEYAVRAEITTRNEVGVLAKAFNLMVEKTENHNKLLEIQVMERTSELYALNEELEASNESIEAMNEELKAQNETLDTNAREMEAMYEELQVTNEALDNKNKEVEAMNEELHVSNEALAETRDALWSEMELAQKLQSVLIPKKPEIPGFDISAFMNTTTAVGGDYYDVINIEGKDWFIIGDVSGHGVTAGLIMMMVQTSIHIALEQKADIEPGELLTIINKIVHANISKLGGNRYMTLTVFACLDNDKFSFAGAHLPVIIYRKATGKTEFLETTGAWVGLIESVKNLNKTDTFSLEKGDAILLYTDGITEGVLNNGKQFTQEGLANLFLENIDLDSEKICENIRKFSGTLDVDDDVSIMVMKKV